MKLRVHKEIVFGLEAVNADDGSLYRGIKGIRAQFGRYHLELRRKFDHEKESPWDPATPTHWWRPSWTGDRGKLSDEIFLSLRSWCVDLSRRNMTYAEYCGVEDLHMDWILDEFDASFNQLAAASLKYHLELSICNNEDRRDRYEDLIERLTEDPPTFTDEEMAILHPDGWKWSDEFEDLPDGGARLRPASPERKAVYEAFRAREEEYLKRQERARHLFVDIMPYLWS